MDVYWLEQGEADVARNDDWFSAGEKACLDAKRFPKRRADWRLGRWTAKRALAVYLDRPGDLPSLAHIEICPAPTGAPEAFLADQPAGVTISLSHREGTALCAIAAPDAQLGCDLERVEPRSEAFVADYFTDEEQALIAGLPATDRPQLLALLWSAKESVLKALHEGLRRDTRSVTVSLGGPAEGSEVGGTPRGGPALSLPQDEAGWHPLHVRSTDGQLFHGWWRQTGGLLRTVVSAPPPTMPIALRIPESRTRCVQLGSAVSG